MISNKNKYIIICCRRIDDVGHWIFLSLSSSSSIDTSQNFNSDFSLSFSFPQQKKNDVTYVIFISIVLHVFVFVCARFFVSIRFHFRFQFECVVPCSSRHHRHCRHRNTMNSTLALVVQKAAFDFGFVDDNSQSEMPVPKEKIFAIKWH